MRAGGSREGSARSGYDLRWVPIGRGLEKVLTICSRSPRRRFTRIETRRCRPPSPKPKDAAPIAPLVPLTPRSPRDSLRHTDRHRIFRKRTLRGLPMPQRSAAGDGCRAPFLGLPPRLLGLRMPALRAAPHLEKVGGKIPRPPQPAIALAERPPAARPTAGKSAIAGKHCWASPKIAWPTEGTMRRITDPLRKRRSEWL